MITITKLLVVAVVIGVLCASCTQAHISSALTKNVAEDNFEGFQGVFEDLLDEILELEDEGSQPINGSQEEKPIWLIDEEAHVDEMAKEEGLVMLEGDELLTQRQVAMEGLQFGRKRVVVNSAIRLWPKGRDGRVKIPYTVSLDKTKPLLRTIRKLSKFTCVDWFVRTNERHYVHIGQSSKGCFSMLGFRAKGKQIINMAAPGCQFQQVSDHELMHTMGFLHEQSRPDRDQYLKIHWANIQRGMASQFKKQGKKGLTFGLPWDWKSDMLYGPKAFGNSRKLTMTRIKGGQPIYKPGRKLSKLDLKGINIAYQCHKYL